MRRNDFLRRGPSHLRRISRRPSDGVHVSITSSCPSTRVSVARQMRAVNNTIASGSSIGIRWPAPKTSTSSGVAATARPSMRASPSGSSSVSGELCSENLGSRCRSAALSEPGIIPSHRCPSRIGASIPESRGDPSRRSVAITAWIWLSNRDRILSANSGTCSSNCAQGTAIDSLTGIRPDKENYSPARVLRRC